MGNKGTDFEKAVMSLLERIFGEINYVVTKSRIQKSGTQNGYDIAIQFLDDCDTEHSFFFECKNYNSTLEFSEISKKIWELESANYKVDGFVTISPHVDISNIDDNIIANFTGKFKFPVRFWTPNEKIEEIFNLYDDIYQQVYQNTFTGNSNRETILRKFKAKIDNMIAEKSLLNLSNRIMIPDTVDTPQEEQHYTTSLDRKLNSVLDEGDEDRLEYHRLRCQYKIYIERLGDVDNVLRNDILVWQNNLRIKAKRLTKNFKRDALYTSNKFFMDFFLEAEKDLGKFLEIKRLTGDTEKLLNGIVFELAAECPLDWSKSYE